MSRREEEAQKLRKDNSGWTMGVWNIWNISITQVLKRFRIKRGKK